MSYFWTRIDGVEKLQMVEKKMVYRGGFVLFGKKFFQRKETFHDLTNMIMVKG